jgi:ubiquinone biosynthesis protein UbiJ
MLHSLLDLLAPAIAERLTLVINHVLGSESIAQDRLRPHAGRRLALHLTHWPGLLPKPPRLAWTITPAGLLEWSAQEDGSPDDLALELDAANPALLLAQAIAGQTPALQIDGDAQLAGDVNWLVQNLRWDAAADLERLFGPVAAQQISRLGAAIAQGLRAALAALKSASALGERLRPRSP